MRITSWERQDILESGSENGEAYQWNVYGSSRFPDSSCNDGSPVCGITHQSRLGQL